MDLHPYCELFPPMSPDELARLAEDIRANGLREPVVTFEDKVLDGRNRLAAAGIAGEEVTFVEYKGSNPLAYVLSKNLHRRHLTESQRGIVAAKIATLPVGANQHTETEGAPIGAPSDPPPVSQAEAAGMLNVSRRTVQRAKTVVEEGQPELVAEVERGEKTVHKASEEAKKAKPKPTVKREPMKDAVGQDVPSSLRDLFGDLWLAESADRLGEALKLVQKTRKATEKKSGAYGSFLKTETILKASAAATVELETAQAMLTEGRPHAVCPKCDGAKCKTCRNAGWLPKYRYMELKGEGQL